MERVRVNIWKGILVLFLAAVYSVVLYILLDGFHFNRIQWIGYVFTMLAFLILFLRLTFSSGHEKESPVLDSMGIILTVVYFIVQIVFGNLALIFSTGFSEKAATVVEIVILAVYIAISLIMTAQKSAGIRVDEKQQGNSLTLRDLTSDARIIAQKLPEGAAKEAAKSLAEELTYSASGKNGKVTETDIRIKNNLQLLSEEADMESEEMLLKRIEKIRMLVVERNEKL